MSDPGENFDPDRGETRILVPENTDPYPENHNPNTFKK